MKIRLSCPPEYESILPRPTIASAATPDWLKKLPASVASEVLAGADVRTVKQCPPFIDAMHAGIVFPLLADVRVQKGGEFSWDWELPVQQEVRTSRSPIGIHVPEQATGYPGVDSGQFVIKFNNFWTVELPPGWSMLFTHPVNRTDLPFLTLTGLVDCDTFNAGFVHFPALWTDAEFEGELKAGTPVAQAWPVQREALELEISAMDGEQLERHQQVQDRLQGEHGSYRRHYRAAR
jgi:hypothetical protein